MSKNRLLVEQLRVDPATKQPVLLSGETIKTLNGESLLGSGNIVISLTLPTSPSFNSITLTSGAGLGKVLTSDANGLASWQPAYSYTLPTSPSFNSIVTSTLQITGGSPALGEVLTSDATGNATWQPLPAPNVYIQADDPSASVPVGTSALWIQKMPNGTFDFKIIEN